MLVRLLFAMLLFSLCRIIFYLLNTDLFPEMTFSHFLYLLKNGLRFDLTAALYVNILFIVGSILPFRFRHRLSYQKILKWIFYITNGIAVSANCIDFIYFRFTFKRTTWSVLQEFSNDKGNFSLMGQFFLDYWYVFLIFAALIFIMVWLYKQVRIGKPLIAKNIIYYPVHTLLMAICVALFIGGVRGGFAHSTRPITISNAGAYVNKPIEIGIVLNTPFSILRTLERANYSKLNYFETPESLEAVYSPIHSPKDSSVFIPKNVVIIIVESLSKEYIGTFNRELENGAYKGFTPFLDSLIAHSYTFDNSFGNGSKSIDAMPSVLASIPSFPDPYVLSVYSNNTIKGIAALLSEKGYDCSFFHGAPNGSMGFDAFARMSGFQHYYGKNEYNNDNDFDGMWAIWDEPFLQFMAQTLNAKQEPFLGTVFTATSHHPFRVPKEYEENFPKGNLPIHQCVGYTDMALQRFFETAAKMPWFENTIFVITADHTNQTAFEKSKTSVGNFSIPIIYYSPNGELATKIEPTRATQQIDIMPTILNYLQYDKPYFAFGFDAFSENDNQNFAINFQGFYNVYKDNFIFQSHDEQAISLFDYDNDILLQKNLIDSLPDKVNEMQTFFKAFRQSYNQRLIDNDMIIKKERD